MSVNEHKGGPTREVVCPACEHRFEIDLAARVWAKVDKNGPNGCWVWTSTRDKGGYGMIHTGTNQHRAHRVVYELSVGPIPDGHQLDHLCENRGCVNPDHLEPVTPGANVLRARTSIAAINAAKTHCPRGHEFTPENTYRYPHGGRSCRICRRESQATERARRRES